MSDKEEITKLYHDMYAAMVAKDEKELNRVHDECFVLVHMTGMHQDKQTYIRAIMDGTLNYYSEKTEQHLTTMDRLIRNQRKEWRKENSKHTAGGK